MSDNEIENDEELLHAKHRKEKKELQAKIQSMKKTATKDKKKKILEEIGKLESDLDRKHAEELNNLASSNKKSTEPTPKEIEPPTFLKEASDDQPQRVTKAQKRREKKAIEEKARQAEIIAQDELNKSGPRNLETKAITKLLKSRKLALYAIPSDGDCLYNAVRHQLEISGRPSLDVKSLRDQTADYIKSNKESLIMYMTNPTTNEMLNDTEFETYCDALRNTPAWGGQIEIQALAHILNAPIEVLQATGPPTIQGEHEFKGPNLVLTYHRHMYSLGEHYNSTKPRQATTDGDKDDEDDE